MSRRRVVADDVGPRPRLGDQPDLAWSGSLKRTPDGIRGELADAYGWRVLLTGHMDGDNMLLAGNVARFGDVLPPWGDDNIRADLSEMRSVAGWIKRGDGKWDGTLGRLALSGITEAPGVVALRGRG